MAEHIIPLFALQKAKKNGTWKLVQQSLLDVLKSGTAIAIQDDNGETIATLTTPRDFANWWNQNIS